VHPAITTAERTSRRKRPPNIHAHQQKKKEPQLTVEDGLIALTIAPAKKVTN
jgi:hypothetical protein